MKTHFKLFSSVILICWGCLCSYAQRLVINNNGYITIDGGAHLILTNSNSNAITLLGLGGNIVSESENDVVNWSISTASGIYTIPFTTASGVKIPLTLNILTSGIGSGNILFSTHTDTDGINSWNNADYLPTGVSNMFGTNGLVNNSAFVIDRFWNINAQNYTTKPNGTIDFGYNDAERSQTGNTIGTGTLKAQYYNTIESRWVYPSTGTDGYPTTRVTGVPTTNDFYKTWTLSEENNPLPVELLNFTATEKQEKYVQLDWTTASEIDNDYFSIQRSKDGINWSEINQLQGAGNSSQVIEYTLNDYEPYIGTSYYRLEQFDFDGESEYSNVEAVSFKGLELVNLYPNPFQGGMLNLQINAYKRQAIKIQIYDNKGSVVHRQEEFVYEGKSQIAIKLEHLARGNYIVRVQSEKEIYTDQKELIIH